MCCWAMHTGSTGQYLTAPCMINEGECTDLFRVLPHQMLTNGSFHAARWHIVVAPILYQNEDS